MMKKSQTGLVLALSALFGLSGCSTIGDGVDAIGSGLVYVAEGAQQAISNVEVEKIDDNNFVLQQSFNEPVRELDSWAMRIEAREVCPQGYIYTNRNALNDGAFGISDADCAASGNCTYKLQWRIECQDVPEEPFSFFGKT